MYLSDYINLITEIYSKGLERTIANFRVKFDEQIYLKLYEFLRNTSRFEVFTLNDDKLNDVKEIKTCIINKKEDNLTICLINPKHLVDTKKKKNKYIDIVIKQKGENSEMIKDYMKNNSNSFNSFLKKKNTKEKVSLAVYRKYINDENSERSSEYSTEYQKIKIDTCDKYYIKKKTINLTLYIEEDRISTKGGNKCSLRTMIPNTITISLVNNSRLMIFNNGIVQVIPSKDKSEITHRDFLSKILYLYEILLRTISVFHENYKTNIEEIEKLRNNIILGNKYKVNELINYKIESMNNDFSYKNVNIVPFPIIDNYYFSKLKFYGGKNINIKSINDYETLQDRIEIINIIVKSYQKTYEKLLKLKKDIFEYDINFLERKVRGAFLVDIKKKKKINFNENIETKFSNNIPKSYIKFWCFIFRIHFLENENTNIDDIFELNDFFKEWFDGFYEVIMKLIIFNFIIDKKKTKITIEKKTKKIELKKISSLPKYFNYQDQVDKFMEITLYLIICYYIEKYNLSSKYNFMNIKLYNSPSDYAILFSGEIFNKMIENEKYFYFLVEFYKNIFKNKKNDKLMVYITYLRYKLHRRYKQLYRRHEL